MSSPVTDPPAGPAGLAVVLAAGDGTRMNSAVPKVLHQIAGRSMLGHVLAAAGRAGMARIAVIVGPGRDDVAAEARRHAPAAAVAVQQQRLGTAHAALQAGDDLRGRPDDIVICFGDTPLVAPETFARLQARVRAGADVAVLGFEAADPFGYGRLVTAGGDLVAIREEKDASEAERAITLCNAGLMAFSGAHALAILERIGNANAKGEYYLSDAVEVARAMGLATAFIVAGEGEVMGINDRAQLAAAEEAMQRRLRAAAMTGGATLIAPDTVFLSADTRIGRDVVIEPHVVVGPGVVIDNGAVIHAFSHLEGAHVGAGASVGPFARLRPGASLGAKSRVGNFVELKNTILGAGAKANHLTYLGDATIGSGANIGAGTITCNYDGFRKHRTSVGEGAFIGSNSALVAPVSVGDGAFVAAGSVVTSNVPADALGVARARQQTKPEWAKAFREKFGPAKKD